jgi:hypothetical protein
MHICVQQNTTTAPQAAALWGIAYAG